MQRKAVLVWAILISRKRFTNIVLTSQNASDSVKPPLSGYSSFSVSTPWLDIWLGNCAIISVAFKEGFISRYFFSLCDPHTRFFL